MLIGPETREPKMESARRRFRISRVNLGISLVLIPVAIVSAFFSYEVTNLSRFIGFLIGLPFWLVGISTLMSWLVWRASKSNTGNVTYAATMLIMVLGLLGQLVSPPLQHSAPAAKDWREETTIVRQVVADIVKDEASYSKSWLAAYEASAGTQILNPIHMNSREDLRQQQGILRNYVEQSEFYLSYYQGRIGVIEQRLLDLEIDREFVRGAIVGIQEQLEPTQDLNEAYLSAHRDYASSMLGVTEVLDQNFEFWSLSPEGQIVMSDSQAAQAYDLAIVEMMAAEDEVNQSAARLEQLAQ